MKKLFTILTLMCALLAGSAVPAQAQTLDKSQVKAINIVLNKI